MMQRRYETIVGLFVVLSLGALLAMVLVIAQQTSLWEDKVTYRAIFKNIGGLKAGAEVRLAGFVVGNVKEIQVNPQGELVVTFEVLAKYSSRIRRDSRATIGWLGLLGEKSLDLTSSQDDNEPVIPPDGIVTTSPPLDFTQLFDDAKPIIAKLQNLFDDLEVIAREVRDPEGEFKKALQEVKGVIYKLNQAKGTLGLLVNDPTLYRETTQSVASIRKFVDNLAESKGVLGTLVNDPAFKAQFQKAMADLQDTVANLKQMSANLKETAARLPEMTKKGEAFLDNLHRAGKGLPDLVDSGQELLSDADKVAKAAQKLWLLRKNVPQPKERTIRVDRDTGKGKE
jgi:phospholipid/cholesterol/gamma-HCH transport system substrate-binding protein